MSLKANNEFQQSIQEMQDERPSLSVELASKKMNQAQQGPQINEKSNKLSCSKKKEPVVASSIKQKSGKVIKMEPVYLSQPKQMLIADNQKSGKENQTKTLPQKYQIFEETDHPHIIRCILCGFFILNPYQKQRIALGISHVKENHSQFSSMISENIIADKKNDQFLPIATQLYKFARNDNNQEVMEFILGQKVHKSFQVYAERLPVSKDLQKWVKVIETVYRIYQ